MKESLREAASTLNIAPFDVADRIKGLLSEIEELKKQLSERESAGQLSADSLLADAQEIASAKVAGTKLIVAEVPSANPNLMRQLIGPNSPADKPRSSAAGHSSGRRQSGHCRRIQP